MRFTISAAILAFATQLVNSHYTFPNLVVGGSVVGGEYQYIRMTDNHYSRNPVTDVSSSLMKCYESNTASSTSTYTVAAGSTIGFKADQALYHQGYLDIYMAKANPSANTESAGSGAVWFKVAEWVPGWTKSGGFTWPSENQQTFTFTVPQCIPAGDYLVRIEHIALHAASTFGGAQLYIACAQIKVTGGGSKTPGSLVSFPGAYTGNEPGILINIYNVPSTYTGYKAPGPAKFTC